MWLWRELVQGQQQHLAAVGVLQLESQALQQQA
jgi:hypothetical protein